LTAPEPLAILRQFGITDARISPVPGGHINRSWRVLPQNLLLQRLNPTVFPDGAVMMSNVASVCRHLKQSAVRQGLDLERQVLRLVPTSNGAAAHQADDATWWRLLHFIDRARTLEQTSSPAIAREAGRAFGRFQLLLADYSGPPLRETIPGFHDTRRRVERLVGAAGSDSVGRAAQVKKELEFARSRRELAEVLPPLLRAGALPTRVVHNDAKLSNVLFDAEADRALAVVDLDTVMPGTLLYDTGDLIRSLASPTAEDEADLARIQVSGEVVESLLAGFEEGAGGTLTETERGLLVFSGILLAYEQGVRFLTDYLEGDRYYRVTRPGQNLDRSRAQFRLVECLEAER
jgi:hypothetical protein